MRIISGKNRGRHIVAPDNLPVRPTTDLGKESLFNILNNYFYFDRVRVLDLFSGTGNLSYEFASRGALSVIAVDSTSSEPKSVKMQKPSRRIIRNLLEYSKSLMAVTAVCERTLLLVNN